MESGAKKIQMTDLFRFIKNRSGRVPNFAMLLGAGCSVASGIKSAGQLVEEWKEEIYEEKLGKGAESKCEIDSYLNENDLIPPSTENPYSYYFELRYPLEQQRVIFIENQIDAENVCPSIGYAALVEIAKENYIDAFFTTNFDDLLNESFYIYDNKQRRKPFVFYDSNMAPSVTSISRIKIFKLHGDYLYGKMKITENETQELSSTNINNLETIVKERGLIVVGYSGSDDSIMKALDKIAEDENNCPNGIFWCIKKGEQVSEKVESFFNRSKLKDKSYLVEIDGFDEFLLDLYVYLGFKLDKTPVLKASDDVKDKILRLYTSVDSNSENIEYILQQLRQEKFNEPNADEFISNSKTTSKKYMKIALHMLQGEYKYALTEIDNKLDQELSEKDEESLLSLKAECLHLLKDDNEALKVIEKLISKEPYSENNYLNACLCEEKIEKKLKLVDRGLEFLPSSISLLNEKAEILKERDSACIEYVDKYVLNPNPSIVSLLEKSNDVNKSVYNKAWQILFDYLFEYSKKDNNYTKCKEYVMYYFELTPYAFPVIKRYASLLFSSEKKNYKDIVAFIDAHKIDSRENEFKYETLKILFACKENKYSEIIKYCKHKFKWNEIESGIQKAKLIYQNLRNPQIAITCLRKMLDRTSDKNVAKVLVGIYLDLDAWMEAEEIIKKYGLDYNFFEEAILTAKGNYIEIEKHFWDKISENSDNYGDIVGYSHALLMQKKFDEAKDFCKGYLEKFFDKYTGTLAINYYLAKQGDKEKLTSEKNINEMASSSETNFTTIAACLMKQEKRFIEKAEGMIRDMLNRDFSELEFFKHCYVFRKYLPPDKLQEQIISQLSEIHISESDWEEIKESFD